MKRCKQGPICTCLYVTNGGYCNLPNNQTCLAQEASDYLTPPPCNNEENCIKPRDINNIKIKCDEITLTKDSVGIRVDMSIRDFDKFETIEINGRVFKRVREE